VSCVWLQLLNDAFETIFQLEVVERSLDGYTCVGTLHIDVEMPMTPANTSESCTCGFNFNFFTPLSSSRLQLLHASDTIFQLEALERSLEVFAHINIDLPHTISMSSRQANSRH
jgi:hypothetical protein